MRPLSISRDFQPAGGCTPGFRCQLAAELAASTWSSLVYKFLSDLCTSGAGTCRARRTTVDAEDACPTVYPFFLLIRNLTFTVSPIFMGSLVLQTQRRIVGMRKSAGFPLTEKATRIVDVVKGGPRLSMCVSKRNIPKYGRNSQSGSNRPRAFKSKDGFESACLALETALHKGGRRSVRSIRIKHTERSLAISCLVWCTPLSTVSW